MGCFLYWIRERRWNLPWYVRIAILILVFVLLYREESYMTVFIDCICILALTPVIEGTSWVMRVLNNRVTASLGKRSMSIYLLHVWMYSVPGLWLNQQLMDLPTSLRLILLWLIPLVVLCALSYPVSALLDWIAAFLYRITSMLAARISAFLKKHNILQCRNKAD